MQNLRLLLIVASVTAIYVGCNRPSSDEVLVGNVTFTLLSDETVYFTNPEGCLAKKNRFGDTQLCASPDQGSFSYVESSPDGKLLAIVLSSVEAGVMPVTLLLQLQEGGGFVEIARTDGDVPCFRDGLKSLFVCRPQRYVKQSGFGGRFWTDYKIFLWDWEDNVLAEFSSEIFNRVDDLAWDNARNELLLSAFFVRADETVYENTVSIGESGVSNAIQHDCGKSHVCCGDPDFSYSRDKLVYISDKRQPFSYDLIVADRQLRKGVRLSGTEDYRFFKHPEFDSEGVGVYALAASEFTFDGQPIFDLVYFYGDESKVVLSSTELLKKRKSGRKMPVWSRNSNDDLSQ